MPSLGQCLRVLSAGLPWLLLYQFLSFLPFHLPLLPRTIPLSGNILDRSWDYYAQHGIFVHRRWSKDLANGMRARFLSMKASEIATRNGRTGLEEDFEAGDGFDEVSKFLQASNGDPKALQDLSYLHDKTVLLIGDSVDRIFVDFIVKALPNSMMEVVNLHEKPHDLLPHPDQFKWAEPRHCSINPEIFRNTNVWFLMGCGVTTTETDWKHKGEMRSPKALRPKVKLLKEAMDQHNIRPDLVILHTNLWDLATANIRDMYAQVPAAEQLSLSFLDEYRNKTTELLGDIRDYWPKAALMTRLGHHTHVSTGAWFAAGAPSALGQITRQPFATNKMGQLNEMLSSIIESDYKTKKRGQNAWWPFDLPHAVQAFKQDFDGDIHFGDTGKSIHLQMLLYYLKHIDRLRS